MDKPKRVAVVHDELSEEERLKVVKTRTDIMTQMPSQKTAARERVSGELGRLEAAPGFEPGIRALQARALPLGYAAAGRELTRAVRAVNRPERTGALRASLSSAALYPLRRTRPRS